MKNCSELGRAEKETWIPPILDRPHAWQAFPYIKIFQLKLCLTVTTDKFCFHSGAKYNQFTNFESCHKTGLLSCKMALFKHFTHHSNETISLLAFCPQRSYFRTLLMYGFHFLVWFLCVKEIRDTQCGFKLLTREAALQTFSNLHIERW